MNKEEIIKSFNGAGVNVSEVKPSFGIAVDGSSRGGGKDCAYRGISLYENKELFNVKIGEATNNIAEFLGIVHSFGLMIKKDTYVDVYTDSNTAISWIKNRRTHSSKKHRLIDRAEKFLRGIPKDRYDKLVKGLYKWDTETWGEIPADFGYKR